MPIITAFPDTFRTYNRVEVNWADTPIVTTARVLRVNVDTGECAALRPYICFEGDYLDLSCGHGIFWDTEVPLDTSVYYITESPQAPCIPAADPCAPCVPVTVQTLPSTMPSGGIFRLKDPVRPCHDQPMPLCFTQANNADDDGEFCIPGSGIFFASMSTEAYAPNSILLNPVNAALPLSISRARRGVSSTLQVVTRTFDDRDAILTLNAPGSPILVQAPLAYGIADRYMAVSTEDVDRGLSDHRFQVRVIDLPYVQVARPAGPMQGPCGSQMDNLCDIYDTWQELDDSGLNWDDLIRGRASTAGGPGTTGYRTWDDVQADFVDWNAVELGNTWIDVEQGN